MSFSGQHPIKITTPGDWPVAPTSGNHADNLLAARVKVLESGVGLSGVYRLHSNVVPVASLASNPEQDLMTYSMPGGTLASNGQALRMTIGGTMVSSSRSKTVKVYFGATVLGTLGPSNSTAWVKWWFSFLILRTGAVTQITSNILAYATVANAIGAPVNAAETLSGNVTIKSTAIVLGAAVAGDITCDYLLIELVP